MKYTTCLAEPIGHAGPTEAGADGEQRQRANKWPDKSSTQLRTLPKADGFPVVC